MKLSAIRMMNVTKKVSTMIFAASLFLPLAGCNKDWEQTLKKELKDLEAKKGKKESTSNSVNPAPTPKPHGDAQGANVPDNGQSSIGKFLACPHQGLLGEQFDIRRSVTDEFLLPSQIRLEVSNGVVHIQIDPNQEKLKAKKPVYYDVVALEQIGDKWMGQQIVTSDQNLVEENTHDVAAGFMQDKSQLYFACSYKLPWAGFTILRKVPNELRCQSNYISAHNRPDAIHGFSCVKK